MHAIPLRHDDTYYPESDGLPMGETETHRDEIYYLIDAFRERFEDQADVYVGGNLFLYFQQGDPSAVLCPDVMVIQGVPKLPKRDIYKLWEEGEVPCLAIEVTSRSTRRGDLEPKKGRYERLGVEEYFLYDPLLEGPPLQGFRLVDGRYQPAALEPDGSLVSHTTGVTLRMEGREVRAVDTATGRPLRRLAEIKAQNRAAEAEIARLRRELEKHSKGE
jgi:Uma2 family endonuclease